MSGALDRPQGLYALAPAAQPMGQQDMLARLLRGNPDPNLPGYPVMQSAENRPFRMQPRDGHEMGARMVAVLRGELEPTPGERMGMEMPLNFVGSTGGKARDGIRAAQTLPMDVTSRMSRAAEQGYSIPAYKAMSPETGYSTIRQNGQWVETGQRVPITSFQSSGGPHAGFFSDSPDVANRFANVFGNSAVYPVQLKMQNPLVLNAQERVPAGAYQFDAVARKYGTLEDLAQYRAALAEKSPYDGVILQNTLDEGTVYVTRTPQQARGRFANYDPKRVDDPDMLAGFAGLGLLGATAGTSE
jgi:hypothetical protein